MHRLSLIAVILALPYVLAAAESQTRDPWQWPFARTSIWNMPVGVNAKLIPANLPLNPGGKAASIGFDHEYQVKVPVGSPTRQVYPPSRWSQRWPGNFSFSGRNGSHWQMPLHDSFRMADANPPSTPNACVSFLMPDGRSLRQLEPTCRLWDDAHPGRHIVGWPAPEVDLYSQGISGAHWGGGLSVLGGSLRVGEISSTQPIRHALKLNIWANYMHYNSTHRGFRWPADRADSYASEGYKGTNPALRMGSLLALPATITAADLQITSPPGRKLLAALRDYGAYIPDDTAWNAYGLCAEFGVGNEINALGYGSLTGYNGQLNAEFRRMIAALCVVDDNTPTNIGGAGPRRAPLAPRLVDPAWNAPGSLAATQTSGSLSLSWSAPAWTANGYELQRRIGTGAWTTVKEVTGTSTTDTAPTSQTSYRVRGIHTATGNAGAWSTTVVVSGGGQTPSVAPAISTQPQPRSVTVGQTATFSVTASGTPTPSYQWQKNGSAISGATSASYTTPATTLADHGATYRVIVSNSADSVTSSSASLTVTAVVSTQLAINAGGSTVGSFAADASFSGGNIYSTANTVSTSGVSNAAPADLYRSERYATTMSYTLNGLNAGAAYTLRLHFAEIFHNAAGKRRFHIDVNGARVQSDLDIWQAAGGINRALVRSYAVQADTSGRIIVAFSTVIDHAKLSGLELIPRAALPEGWTTQVIGSATPVGSTTFDGSTWTLRGAGADIWNASDGFRSAWQPISGDFDAVVRVTGLTNTHAWAKAGLMLRENTAAGSRHISCFVTPSNGTALQWRANTGGSSSSLAGPKVTAPTWLKLARRGNTVTALQSADGSTWRSIGSRTVTIPTNALIGLAVTSHVNGKLTTATFTDVEVLPVGSN